MNVNIDLISVEQKSVLIQLMELYNYEFTEYDDEDINDYGYYGYSHIDDYWNEEGRYPYLIRVDGKIAGFVLVCPYCQYSKDANSKSIAEFFIMIKYRLKGIGQSVAKKIFDKHKGNWEVLQLSANVRAQRFWKKVVDQYTESKYRECGSIQEGKVGFLFNNLDIIKKQPI